MTDTKCAPDGIPFDQHGNPRKRYVRITVDGTSCICEPSEVESMTEDGCRYELSDVMLSEREYAELPEFQGW